MHADAYNAGHSGLMHGFQILGCFVVVWLVVMLISTGIQWLINLREEKNRRTPPFDPEHLT